MRRIFSCVVVAFVASALVSIPRALQAQDVEQLERDCEAGVADACRELGRIYRNPHSGFDQDVPRAISLYERACELGSGSACNDLGRAYWRGLLSFDVDYGRALSLFERACELGTGIGCFSWADMYERGHGVSRDLARAASLYEQSCDLGLGCSKAAEFYEPRGLFEDSVRWAELYEKACDLEEEYTCFRLGLMYDIGHRVPKDTAYANVLLKKACMFGHQEACGMVRR